MSTPQGESYSYRYVTPRDLAMRMAAGSAPRLVDLREPYEIAAGAPSIEGAESLPLSELADWWPALDREAELVFQCNTGRRSRALCCALAVHGFAHVCDLAGGVEAWQAEVAGPSAS